MKDEIYAQLKMKLTARPKQLTDLTEWLFVVINTAKSIIDNVNKQYLDSVMTFAECKCTSQIQYEFDRIQGQFGRESFSQRYSPNYLYLCSLVANYPNQDLLPADRELLKEYGAVPTYLLYEL